MQVNPQGSDALPWAGAAPPQPSRIRAGIKKPPARMISQAAQKQPLPPGWARLSSACKGEGHTGAVGTGGVNHAASKWQIQR